MKIGIVTPTFYPYPGGISEYVYHTYFELRKRGHEVKIITTFFGDGLTEFEENIYRVGRSIPILSNGSIGRVAFSLQLPKKIKRILDAERFDLLHIHEPLVPTLCLISLRHSRTVNIGTFHTFAEFSLGYFIFRPFLRRYNKKLHGRIAVSESARNFVDRYFGGEYRIIPNGIDIDRFNRVGKIKKFDDGKLNILFVGRLEPRKGVKYLLKAFPLIKKKLPNSRLIIVGSGPLAGYYRQFVPRAFEEDIWFEGLVTKEDLPSYYSTCDVFCSPATGKESFGIVLLEAMASGKAIVASDIEGYRHVVTHGQEGLLVKPRDSQAIADSIVEVLSNEPLRRMLEENGKRKARQYSWENVTSRIINFYHDKMKVASVH
ncbi:hypothetical protein DRP98_09005 [candidate division KSB1 bacterium]|nr:MAG: hypothetical protein DRP98_09005 [candidate division KSB1 bacterium]